MVNREIFGSGREDAQRWLAELSPLLLQPNYSDERSVKDAIDKIAQLRVSGPRIADAISVSSDPGDADLASTIRQALEQLPAMDTSLRHQLAAVSPGNPESRVDLDVLKDRLAEQAARTEMGLRLDEGRAWPIISEQKAAGKGLMVIGTGIGGFITLHAFGMIGGMWHAFGPIALLLLGFYAIFGAAVYSMFKMGLSLMGKTTVELVGDELMVKATGPLSSEKTYRLNRNSRFEFGVLGDSESTRVNGKRVGAQGNITFRDATGQLVSMPTNLMPVEAEQMCAYLNQRALALPM